jgi:hypothetical protein
MARVWERSEDYGCKSLDLHLATSKYLLDSGWSSGHIDYLS